MAKLSLWLITLARQRPFSFVDHALRAGDSLLGITDLRQLRVAHLDPTMDSRRLPLRTMFAALFDAFDAAPRPFLVKCAGGQDRTPPFVPKRLPGR